MVSVRLYNTKIPSNIGYVGKTVSDIVDCIQSTFGKLDECVLFEIKVILNELLLNAIKHGNCERQDKFVKATAGIARKDCAFFIIEDEGQGCDHKCLMQENRNIAEIDDLFSIKETGRGIVIVKNLCDTLRFNRKGNRVLVVKKLYREQYKS